MTGTDVTTPAPITPSPITPAQLAEVIAPMLDSALVGFDVDGVLAPLVEHADASRLSPGVAESLAALSARTTGAILSGRSLESLERLFDFAANLYVIGSHGLEMRGDAGRRTERRRAVHVRPARDHRHQGSRRRRRRGVAGVQARQRRRAHPFRRSGTGRPSTGSGRQPRSDDRRRAYQAWPPCARTARPHRQQGAGAAATSRLNSIGHPSCSSATT